MLENDFEIKSEDVKNDMVSVRTVTKESENESLSKNAHTLQVI